MPHKDSMGPAAWLGSIFLCAMLAFALSEAQVHSATALAVEMTAQAAQVNRAHKTDKYLFSNERLIDVEIIAADMVPDQTVVKSPPALTSNQLVSAGHSLFTPQSVCETGTKQLQAAEGNNPWLDKARLAVAEACHSEPPPIAEKSGAQKTEAVPPVPKKVPASIYPDEPWNHQRCSYSDTRCG